MFLRPAEINLYSVQLTILFFLCKLACRQADLQEIFVFPVISTDSKLHPICCPEHYQATLDTGFPAGSLLLKR